MNLDTVPSFLQSIYSILTDESFAHTITWVDNGTAFVIQDIKKFVNSILPVYFKHNRMSSFLRQLNLYSFSKLKHGNSFRHPLFLKHKPGLINEIQRKDLLPMLSPLERKMAKKIYLLTKRKRKTGKQIRNLEGSIQVLADHQIELANELWETRKKTRRVEELLITIVKCLKDALPIEMEVVLALTEDLLA